MKTELTKEIEQALVRKELAGQFKPAYGALEVPCGYNSYLNLKKENIDFATYKPLTEEITCYEIKVTMSDFKSDASLSFYGNKNYLVAPLKLATEINNLYNKYRFNINNPELKAEAKAFKEMSNSYAGIIAYVPGSYDDYKSDPKSVAIYNKAVGKLAVIKNSKKRQLHLAQKMDLIEGILRAGCRDAAKGYLDGQYL